MQRGQAPTASWGRPTMRRCVTAPQGQQAAANTTLAGAGLEPEASCLQTRTSEPVSTARV